VTPVSVPYETRSPPTSKRASTSAPVAVYLVALMLADQGLIGLDEPVARYWPEFAANGKDGVLVRHLMAHTAGLSGWQEKMAPEDLFDWEKATSLLAAQEPWWKPRRGVRLPRLTQGYLIGEVVRRVTGQSFGTFFRTEVAEPLGADFHVGFGPELDDRGERASGARGTGPRRRHGGSGTRCASASATA